MPISGVSTDWCAPPSGARRDARRRGHQEESRVLVARVVQGVEPAADERVVERADRQAAGRRTAARTGRARPAAGTGCSRRCRARCAARAATSPTSGPRRRPPRGTCRALARRSKMPRRLTHAPRLVETVTSGEVVTIRRRSPPCRAQCRSGSGRSLPGSTSSRLGDRQARGHGDARRARAAGRVALNGTSIEERLRARLRRQVEAGERLPLVRPRRSPGLPVNLHLVAVHQARRGCPCGRRTAGRSP